MQLPVKECTKCRREQPVDAFPRGAKYSDGRNPWCKLCFKEWREANAQRRRQYAAEYQAENVERLAAYRDERREERSAQLSAWKRANRDRVAEHERRRRIRKRGVPQEPYDRAEVMAAGTCGICTEQVDLSLPANDRMAPTIDHIVPLSRGGTDTRANVQLAHRSCNARKCDREAA